MDILSGMSNERLTELVEALDCSDSTKNKVWNIIMEVKLYELSSEVTDLEKEFMRKRNQLQLLENYFYGFDLDE